MKINSAKLLFIIAAGGVGTLFLRSEDNSNSNDDADRPARRLVRLPDPKTVQSRQFVGIPSIYQESVAHCEGNDIVFNRNDGRTASSRAPHVEERPYTVTAHTFNSENQVMCANLDEALHAIREGSRRWVNPEHESLPSLEAEEERSYFVTDGCDLPFLSADEMCVALNRYSRVIINGDSLSRHMLQGLEMVLKGDLVSGGIESEKKFWTEGSPYQCMCDGQFSENDMCRIGNNVFLEDFTPRDLALCRNLPESEDQFHLKLFGKNEQVAGISVPDILGDCAAPDYRGAVWVFQGGFHYHVKVHLALKEWINPIMNDPAFQECRRLGKLKVIWIGCETQSRSVDRSYPVQSRENTQLYNAEMERILRQRVDDLIVVDWWRLTHNAQTSDGVHFLSDVNLVKANQLMNVLSLM